MRYCLGEDAYCGKFSVTDVFEQYKVPYTVMAPHVVHSLTKEFEKEFFGCGGVAKIDNLQKKLIRLARGGFKHHTTVANGHVKEILEEAFKYYLGYDVVNIEE